MKALGIFLADDDVASSTHGSGNHRPALSRRLDRALSGDPDVLTKVAFLLSEVVMRVDSVKLQLFLMPVLAIDRITHLGQHTVHHFISVVKGELLRPIEVPNVGSKSRVLLGQV